MHAFQWVWDNAAKLRDLAAILAAAGTSVGVLFAIRRFSVERRLQRDAASRRIWAGVLRLCFDHPEYAEPSIDFHSDQNHKLKYTWFVSNVFNALDELLTSSDDTVWRHTASLMVGYHSKYLSTAEFQTSELPTFNSELQSLIRKRVEQPKS